MAADELKNLSGDDKWIRLLQERKILLGMPIGETEALQVVAGILYLDSEAKGSPISLYINSPGGAITMMMAICDTIQEAKSPVHTACIGQAFGAAGLILAIGEPGQRRILREGRVGIGPLYQGKRGQPPEDAKISQAFWKMLESALGDGASQVRRKAEKNDAWWDSEEALRLGFVDEIVDKLP
jgi:ATP-dependent Clp protease protease subunit